MNIDANEVIEAQKRVISDLQHQNILKEIFIKKLQEELEKSKNNA